MNLNFLIALGIICKNIYIDSEKYLFFLHLFVANRENYYKSYSLYFKT